MILGAPIHSPGGLNNSASDRTRGQPDDARLHMLENVTRARRLLADRSPQPICSASSTMIPAYGRSVRRLFLPSSAARARAA